MGGNSDATERPAPRGPPARPRRLSDIGSPRADASEDAIQGLIDRHGLVFIKPVFRGIGKKGKAGLVGKARTLKEALTEKERLYSCEHRHGNAFAKANGVTFEAGVPAEHEVYFSISDDSRFRAPTMTLTHRGAFDLRMTIMTPSRHEAGMAPPRPSSPTREASRRLPGAADSGCCAP
jgi:hypothetical protein